MSIQRATRNTLGASILDFAQFPKRIHKRERRRGGAGGVEMNDYVNHTWSQHQHLIIQMKPTGKKLTVHESDGEHSSLSMSVGHTH